MWSWIGEWFATVDWQGVATYIFLAWCYFALSVIGIFAFPPFFICIYMTEGNLDSCSLGIWGNGYTDRTFGDSDVTPEPDLYDNEERQNY